MNPLTKLQVGHNRGTEDGWAVFAEHRRKVTALLSGATTPERSRLCVLGAGNCNDLDLVALLRSHREIHLVDLDGDALAAGVARQGLADDAGIHRHGGLDVTGILDVQSTWTPSTVLDAASLSACADEPVSRVRPALPGPFDVVASTCLLSQLIGAVVQTAGEAHPRFLELVQAVRAGHLRLLAGLVAPGGLGVLITDFVSSDSYPALGTVPDDRLAGVAAELVRRRNFFHGVNPAALVALFRSDPVLSHEVAGVEPVGPWRWNLGPRCYAVCALKVRRRGDAAETAS